MSDRRRTIALRLMGTSVLVDWEKTYYKGTVVFADYETLTVLVEAGERQFLVSLRAVRVLSLRRERVGVLHGVRLNPWQHGEGWKGCHVAEPGVAEAWLEPLREQVAA